MYNVIISNLSTKNRDKNGNIIEDKPENYVEYRAEQKKISGLYTNDAPIKYLVSLIAENMDTEKDRIKIVAITTDQANDTYERLQTLIPDHCKEIGIDGSLIEFEQSRASDSELAKTIDKTVSYINPSDKVYLDTTGGFRNSSYIIMAVVKILEYNGISLEKAVYSNFQNHEIQDITDTYKMFNLINSADAFTSFGSSKGLRELFKNSSKPEIRDLIDVMDKFSDNIALCRTSGLGSLLDKLNHCLTELENLNTEIESEVLFKSISDVIRRKFNLNDSEKKKNKIDHMDIVKWCIDNQLIQQAVTIYTEKLGEYLYKDKKAFEASEEALQKQKKSNGYFDMYYCLLWRGLMQLEPLCVRSETKLMFEAYTKDKRFVKAMAESDSPEELKKRVRGFELNDQLRKELELFFRLKRAMFDEKGIKYPQEKIQHNLAECPVLAEDPVIEKITSEPKAPDRLVNVISNNDKYFRIISQHTNDLKIYDEAHINNIEYFEDAYTNQKGASGEKSYTVNVELSAMAEVLRDYFYIKNCLRNSINHAGDDSINDDKMQELKEYFTDKGYNTSDDLSIDSIKSALLKAVDHAKFLC